MDITINAQTSVRGQAPSYADFFLNHKGDLTLAFSALVYVVSWTVLMFTHFRTGAEIAVSMAEAEAQWDLRSAIISGEDGRIVFEQKDVEVPRAWSQTA